MHRVHTYYQVHCALIFDAHVRESIVRRVALEPKDLPDDTNHQKYFESKEEAIAYVAKELQEELQRLHRVRILTEETLRIFSSIENYEDYLSNG
jgi:nucleoside phosphorylase